jgi:hypothetical protein
MTDTAKVLAQSIPTAGVLTDTYTVPAATSAIVSTIKVANQGAATQFRVSVAVAAAADTPKQYVYYDVPIAANDTFSATEGWTLGATDVLRCQSGSGQVSFNVFGVQVTP